MSDLDDERFMGRALQLARHAWGQTHPNPMVGAVIADRGRIVAEGWHAHDGGPHAERAVLTALQGKVPPAATLYVTLEPCSTAGRTGACCDAIIAAQVKRVVFGARDPHPRHAGRGQDVLAAAGIEVVSGVLAQTCTDLNLIFNHWITTRQPLLAAKTAVTIDGCMATRTGESRWITNELARADVHRWRRLFPALAVGGRTVMKDNPRLTARQGEEEWCPIRFVFDGLLHSVVDRDLPRVCTDEFKERTTVVTTPLADTGQVRKLRDRGVSVWVIPSATRHIPLARFRRRCAEAAIPGVYFEGGARLIGNLLRTRELDYLFSYRAPALFVDDHAARGFAGLHTAKIRQAVRLAEVRHASFGDDQLMRGRVVYPAAMQVDETALSGDD